jgi:hypothetical protein
MKFIDWTKLYATHKGLWVALDEDNETVVGTGATAEVALENARSKGFANAAIMFVPREVTAFAGHHDVSLHEPSARV